MLWKTVAGKTDTTHKELLKSCGAYQEICHMPRTAHLFPLHATPYRRTVSIPSWRSLSQYPTASICASASRQPFSKSPLSEGILLPGSLLARSCVCIRSRVLLIWKWVAIKWFVCIAIACMQKSHWTATAQMHIFQHAHVERLAENP